MIADLKTSEKNLSSKRAARGKTGACGCFDFVRATLYSPPRHDVITIRPVTPDDFSAVKRMFQDILPNADYTKEYPEFAYVERAFVNWKLDFGNGGDMHLFFEETPEEGSSNPQSGAPGHKLESARSVILFPLTSYAL